AYVARPLFSFVSCFSSSYGDPRDLHSFPTRRSSDLPLCLRKSGTGKLANPYTGMPGLRPGFRPHQSKADSQNMVLQLAQGYRCSDRKSTRLNSSHVKISYAVFCLKKKTTPPTTCSAL